MLTLAGEACECLFTERVCGVCVYDLELDEVWTYVRKHQKRIAPGESSRHAGDAYTFIGLEHFKTGGCVAPWQAVNTEESLSKIR